MYVSDVMSPGRRGKPVVRWKDRVKEYMHEIVDDRGGGYWTSKEGVWTGRGGGSSAVAILFGDISEGNEASVTSDR